MSSEIFPKKEEYSINTFEFLLVSSFFINSGNIASGLKISIAEEIKSNTVCFNLLSVILSLKVFIKEDKIFLFK